MIRGQNHMSLTESVKAYWLPARLARHRFAANAAVMRRLHRLRGFPDYEALLERAYRSLIRAGDTVIDVGAHTGRHTAVFRELVGGAGRVLAFEPLPDVAQALRDRGFDDRVQIFQCALSDFSGRSSFVHARGTPQESGLKERLYNHPALAAPTTIEVEVRRLDEFLPLIDQLSFLKLDIEGAELSCLRGAVELVRRFRPVISVEFGGSAYGAYGETPRALFDFAAAAGYRIGDLFGGICPDLESWLRVCDTAYWDYFLVPSERCAAWHRVIPTRAWRAFIAAARRR